MRGPVRVLVRQLTAYARVRATPALGVPTALSVRYLHVSLPAPAAKAGTTRAKTTKKKAPAAKKTPTKKSKAAAKTKAKGTKAKAKGTKAATKPKTPKPKRVTLPKQFNSIWQLFNAKETKAAKAATTTDEKLSLIELTKSNAQKYQALSAFEREELEAELQEHKKEFKVEYEKVLAHLTPEQIDSENRIRAQRRKAGKSHKANIRDPNKPKRPPNGYMLFLAERRADPNWVAEAYVGQDEAAIGPNKIVLLTQHAAKEWRGLSEADKSQWTDEAAKLKAEYDVAKKAYDDEKASA